ncbi:L,D-transpeptidase family protein [Anatilimnocola floriformis]|uniref:L,D-transpeptidase family protein n=1 Tax=Anatilimnocola floriformis TaxID=2948575 RepID=UPI0020C4ED47|nr:L,D-transpeptidase family protein [Anatilimnocola floriformis]
MAVFEKSKGQDLTGWDKITHTQTIKEGKDTRMTLAGYDMTGFYVISTDTSVCTIHETTSPTVKQPVAERQFVVTGVRDGSCEIQALYSEKNRTVLASFKVIVTNVKMAAKLVFFPGERTVGECTMGTIFVVGGNGEHYDAAGGAPAAYKGEGGHTSDPTPPGVYVLGPQHKATTGTWPNSAIPWGAQLRLGKEPGRVEYLQGGNSWAAANGPTGIIVKYMKQFAARDGKTRTTEECDNELAGLFFTDRERKVLRTTSWDQNDFGQWSWNLTLNGKITPFYIHTTPLNELQTVKGWTVKLDNSHGCVHLAPKTRDKMMADGYLKKGVIFEVRKYSDVAPRN